MASDRTYRDDERLPWLESAEPERDEGLALGRVLVLAVIGIAVLALLGLGIWKLRSGGDASGDGTLIAAEETPYKVAPPDPGGLKVEGEGDSAVATSQGKAPGGAIDLNAVPEAPVEGRRVVAEASPTPTGAREAVAKVPESRGRLVAAAPVSVARAAPTAGGGGSLVQLGAYPSEAVANGAWDRFSKRFGYLAALGKSVQPVARDGKTLYRLRVDAGSANQAADICGRLKVAGESCFVAG